MSDSSLDEIVTKFLLNTTRLLPKISRSAGQTAETMCDALVEHPVDEKGHDNIPLVTGSVAEFYIEPMLQHVGDIDGMFHRNTELAIPRGHPPPTQLPDEFSNYVKVHEIVDSHLPGYVYLEERYLLTECSEDDKYISTEYRPNSGWFKGNGFDHRDHRYTHGPAVQTDLSRTPFLSIDAVLSVRCLSWPPQAADWPTRHRNYGWPDSATVDRVVSNGCDVVGVAHRQSKGHIVMGRFQWRFSFSRAETVLLNSWMPLQQIVYHMLHVYVKTAQLTDNADNSEVCTLSNYHIKTLMLWACEQKPKSW